jgi:tetratricopeptide (TPR) repeat protein
VTESEIRILFEEAFEHHANGRLQLARGRYQQVLEYDPKHVEALHHLGLVFLQSGDLSLAISKIRKSVELAPENTDALTNLGYCFNQAFRFGEAANCCESAVRLEPQNDIAWTNLGNAYRGLRHWGQAQRCYSEAYNLDADNPAYIYNLGLIYFDQQNYKMASDFFRKSLSINCGTAEVHNNLGACLIKLKEPTAALPHLKTAIHLMPNYAEAWSNRGVALNDMRRHDEALESYSRALELMPNYAEAWSNRGVTLNDMRRHEEALESYSRALELMPNYAEAWSNRGVTLNDMRRHEEALESYSRALEFEADNPEAQFNRSVLELSRKEFQSGFQGYSSRWRKRGFPSHHFKTSVPAFKPGSGQASILLWAEQGLGDEVFYAGRLHQAFNEFQRIGLIADKRLHLTLKRSFPSLKLFVRGIESAVIPADEFDSHAPIGDLGRIMSTNETEIKCSRRPYFVPDAARRATFLKESVFEQGKTVCGLAWFSLNKRIGPEKSIELEKLLPILKNPRLCFVNLQYGEVASDIAALKKRVGVTIHQIQDLNIHNDIDGLLAAVDSCDIVVTTSNVVAHLAGAVGKKGCVLVPYSTGRIWYWHQNEVMSLWYPTLRIIYQDNPLNWEGAIKEVQEWLELHI